MGDGLWLGMVAQIDHAANGLRGASEVGREMETLEHA
jgi:hypothetical protein